MRKIRVLCVVFSVLLVAIGMVGSVPFVFAPPTVPTTIPNGNPVNVIWCGHAYPAIVGSAMLEAGWVIGDQLDEAGAYYMLMWQDGPAARWYLWIYDGGRDAEWGYWSYAGAAHYYWNILGGKWVLDDLEGPEDKVYNDLASTFLPWNVESDSYWLNNAGTYFGEYNDGWAQRFTFSEWTQGEGSTQWTTNPTFITSDPASKWDLVNYEWDWTPGGPGTTYMVPNDYTHYAQWNYDGHVALSAYDDEELDSWGEAARVTYGPFNIENHQYPYQPPPCLTVARLDILTIKGVVGWYWSGVAPINCWTGIKFDAWFSDPSQGGRPLMIEMYFLRTGLNLLWAADPTAFYKTNDEVARYLSSGTIDDHLVNLWAFPGWCDTIGGQIVTLVIDLKAIWLRAQQHFGRSNQDQLYAVALDLESGANVVDSAQVFACANELKVTYDPPAPNTPSTPSGRNYGDIHETYSYSTSTTDPNGYNVRYLFDWGDGTTTTTGWYASGATISSSHSWSSTGYKYIKVKAQNSLGIWSLWSPSLRVYISNGDGCVAEGTLVTMADDSLKPVEKIKVGDQVLGFDPTTGSYMAENVLDVTKTFAEVIVNFNNGRLRVTPADQPIFVRNATYEGWVRDPATMQVGWEIYEPKTGTWVTVTSMTYEEGKTKVYDLVLDGYTTYIANRILLMDKC